MQLVGDLVEVSNAEVFQIVRRTRDERLLKGLPHFHSQSMSTNSGSSGHQQLAFASRFHKREDLQKQDFALASASLVPEGLPHNALPHMEVRLLRYLAADATQCGPSSALLSHAHAHANTQTYSERTRAALTALQMTPTAGGAAIANSPSLYTHERTPANLRRLAACHAEMDCAGRQFTVALVHKVRALFASDKIASVINAAAKKSGLAAVPDAAPSDVDGVVVGGPAIRALVNCRAHIQSPAHAAAILSKEVAQVADAAAQRVHAARPASTDADLEAVRYAATEMICDLVIEAVQQKY